MKTLDDLKVKLYADGADIAGMLAMYKKDYIRGFTTNPTLMRKAGIQNYGAFAREILGHISDRPISFEVFADELPEMEQQARVIARWAKNVYVKIPITNTRGVSTAPIIHSLSREGIPLNITAVFTEAQSQQVIDAIDPNTPAILSVFAGRIADAGLDPMPLMKRIRKMTEATPKMELLWASPREVLNVLQADEVGCHIITATNDILNKVSQFGKDLTQFSLETVQMFYNDAQASAFSIQK
jgi:transaldolase